jgi:protein-ribulosamine 3-kinase
LAPWGLVRHKIGRPFLRAYYRHFPIAAPEEDQDDRNMLYCLRWDLKGAVIYPGDARYRKYCVDAMRTLIEKFPEGYEGWARERGETPAPPPQKRSSPSFDKVGPTQTKVIVEQVEVEIS